MLEEEEAQPHSADGGKESATASPMRRAVCEYWPQILLVMGHVCIWSCSFYVPFRPFTLSRSYMSGMSRDGCYLPYILD